MYEVNDVILYRGTGVCKITAFTEKRFGDETQACYALEPLYLNNLTIFVPHTLEQRMRKLRSREEIFSSLETLPELDTVWIPDVHMRRRKYRALLLDGTQEEMLQILKTLYLAKQRKQFRGQKNGLCVSDDHLFHDCKRMLAEELACACGCVFAQAEKQLNEMMDAALKPVSAEKKL
ncbi:MAG: CarD family transcriptional regulator [Ruminococcus sp.]